MAIAVPAASLSPAPAVSSDAGHLFEQYSERIYGYCLRFLGSRTEAEDAMQTTFMYAHRALERGVVPELEYPWLHSIAKNVCRWQLRTLSRRGSLTTDLDLDALPSSPGRGVELNELRGDLEDALATIPESQRKALVLREWHGLESHEIATQLGMSTTATYALLTRARRSLAKALTASGSRPVLGLDFLSALGKLKALLGGGTAKVVATTVAVGSVAVGGVAVERAVDGSKPSQPTPPVVESSAPSRSTTTQQAPTPTSRGGGNVRNGRAAVNGASPTAGTATPKGGAGRPPATAGGPTAPAVAGGLDAPGTQPGSGGSAGAPSPAPSPVPVAAPNPQVEKPPVELPPIELPPLVQDLVDNVVEPLLDDPLAVVPPVDAELPLDEVAPPLSEVEEDLEEVLETPLPDITPPLPKLPLLP